ncbi:MAG: YeeE/YedE family protein [Kiritimatiellia bacterium]
MSCPETDVIHGVGARAILWRVLAGVLTLVAVVVLFRLHASENYGRSSAWVFLLGLLFGWVLQRSRFCFFCMLRDLFEDRNSRTALAMLLALAVGIVGHVVLFTAWIPNPLAGHLPPRAHIGPFSWVIALGGFVFGVGMSLSGSCISAHLYRLGEGSRLSPVALLGGVAGAALGLWSWNTIYLRALISARPVWLPAWQGFSVAVVIPLLVLAALAVYLIRYLPVVPARAESRCSVGAIMRSVFVDKWAPWVGAAFVGLISTAALFRGAPLGVTAEMNRVGRLLGDQLAVLPQRLEGLDAMRGCRIAADSALFSPNALFVLALVIGGMIGSFGSGTVSPSVPKLKAYPLALLGGVLLGWGSFVALGCSIGTLLSGIHAGSLGAWVFAVAMVVGVRAALPIRQWAER